MNRSRIQFFFNKNIPIDISSGIHGYNFTDLFINVFRIARILG